ncbi:hypothetical protein ACIQRW_08695 [Streptomyces sp. NPDC091287]|uniref:hypothetical protein n=1 Tax=Streptomyces sp. NPDC091287 TaxID=3365988 RepID=UPI00380B0F20
MPISAGQTVTAGQLNRMQPVPYEASASGSLVGPQTGVDVPGATVTFTTTTDNAVAVVNTSFDFDFSAATTTLGSGRLVVDGVATTRFALFQQGPGASADRVVAGQDYRVDLGTAGSHTLVLNVTVPTGMTLNQYTAMVVTVYEVV